MSIVLYNQFSELVADGTIDLDNDTFKVGLVSSSYTPALTHTLWTDASANEVTGTNYTAGGYSLTATWVRSAGVTTFDSDNPTWAQHASGFSNARYAILYDDTLTSPLDGLIGYVDLTTDRSNTADAFTITISSSGWFSLATS